MIINSAVQLGNVKRSRQKDCGGWLRAGCFDALQPLGATFWAKCLCAVVFFLILPFESTYASTFIISYGETNATNLSTYTTGVTVNGTYDLNTNRTLCNVTGSGTLTNTSATTRTLTLNSSTNTTFSGVITATTLSKLNLLKSGSGTLTLTGTNTYTGSTTFDSGGGGILQIGDGGTTGSIAANVNTSNGTLVFNRSDAYTYAGNISGTGTVTKNGSGTLTLNGSYSGSCTLYLNAGTLTLTGSYSGSGTLYLNAGTLNIAKVGTGVLGSGNLRFSSGILQAGATTAVTNPITLDAKELSKNN